MGEKKEELRTLRGFLNGDEPDEETYFKEQTRLLISTICGAVIERPLVVVSGNSPGLG